jgi:hypothetical protein
MTSIQHNHINFIDKRKHSRHDCNLRGKVKLGISEICECIVKDISIGGAKLLIQSSNWTPSEFSLELPNGFPSITARTVWTDNQTVGVEFVR